MNFLNLEYFIALVHAGNISRAATQLYISQQTLSENLSKLERELGTPLFTRGRQITLTQAGKRFYSFADHVISDKNDMLEDIQEIIEAKKKNIYLSVATFESPPFLSSLLMRFYQYYPDHCVTVHTQKNIESGLDADSFEFDFILSDFDLDGTNQLSSSMWNYEILSRTSRFAIMANRSLLLKTYGERWPEVERQLLEEHSLAAVAELPFLTVRNQNNLQYKFITKAFEMIGRQPNIAFQADMNSLNKDMCTIGLAAYFLPEGLCKLKMHTFPNVNELCIYGIDTPGMYNGLAINYPKKKKLTAAQKKLIEICKEFIE